MIYNILGRHELVFDRTQGTWKTRPVEIELQPNPNPYHAKLYPAPRAHENIFKKEVERLSHLGVPMKVNI